MSDASATLLAPDHARSAFDALADAYHVFAAGYAYDRWMPEILALAARHGVRDGRMLDVACGTGHSFLPLLDRGWEVTACDLSPRMVAHAQAAAGGRAEVLVADMRALPELGAFDLLTCLDDSLNYLLEEDELAGTFAGFARSLAPDGVAVWDINTLVNIGAGFASDWVRDTGDVLIVWHGRSREGVAPGGLGTATLDVLRREGDAWHRTRGTHVQRNWRVAEVVALAEAAGLQVVDVLGQRRGAVLERPADEAEHPKVLFVARRA